MARLWEQPPLDSCANSVLGMGIKSVYPLCTWNGITELPFFDLCYSTFGSPPPVPLFQNKSCPNTRTTEMTPSGMHFTLSLAYAALPLPDFSRNVANDLGKAYSKLTYILWNQGLHTHLSQGLSPNMILQTANKVVEVCSITILTTKGHQNVPLHKFEKLTDEVHNTGISQTAFYCLCLYLLFHLRCFEKPNR